MCNGDLKLAGLFFLQWMPLAMWMVPLSAVLDGQGLGAIKPYAFASSALAAFVSPLFFGALADRHLPPVRVLRRLCLATAAVTGIAAWSFQQHWSAAIVLGIIQLQAFCSAPTVSISTSIVLSRLRDSERDFGPIRAVATVGFMCGCWLISLLHADASPIAAWVGASAWLVLGLYTFQLSVEPPVDGAVRSTWRQRMGWDAVLLLKNPEHRVVFLAASLYSIPLAGFYPFTPVHLHELGFQRTAAWMTLGQVTEVLAMFGLARMFARCRLKWIFMTGLSCGLLRFALCGMGGKLGVLAGVTLHGFSYTFFFISAQIYLARRVDPVWRTRAQALFALMTGGVGSLLGYLTTGWWFDSCTVAGRTHWSWFWMGLVGAVAVAQIYFMTAYRGAAVRQVGGISGKTFLRAAGSDHGLPE